jgi:hypothetical protein
VVDRQQLVKHSAISFMAATLDGEVEGTGAIFETKLMLPWPYQQKAAVGFLRHRAPAAPVL